MVQWEWSTDLAARAVMVGTAVAGQACTSKACRSCTAFN
jgi:hypothetical protein